MIPYPHINPEIVRIGPFAIRWYGLMYLIGFAASYLLVRYQVKKKDLELEKDFLDSLYTYIIIGLIIGARLGYVVFYNSPYYLNHPLEIFWVWQGGLSFHGGFIGSVAAGIVCCRRYRKDSWMVADLVTVSAPIGVGMGRIGNFINGELYGRITTVPWAMVFPTGGMSARHPSQLYEFFLEGVVLFIVLWLAKDRLRVPGILTALFVTLYGIFRFLVEFFREPDEQLGLIAGFFTMGQILSAGMVLAGLCLLYVRIKTKTRAL